MEKKLIYIFILLQPFIDLITALTTRFEFGIVSVGIIIRGIFILGLLVYLFFFNRSKYRTNSIKYLVLLGIFYILYLITKPGLFSNFSFLYNEIVYIFKYSYYIISFIALINIIEQNKLDYKKVLRLLFVNAIVYSSLIIIPTITNTGFNSYNNNEGYGIVGWFYSANEVSAILTMLYPILFLHLDHKFNLKNCFAIVLLIASIIIIGTKAPYYSMLAITIILFGYYLFNFIKTKKKIKQLIFAFLIILISVLARAYTPANINLEQRVECLEDYQNGVITDTSENELKCEVAEDQQVVMLSGREVLLSWSLDIYKDSNLVDKFFGIGFSNREVINNEKINKLVEMDLFDIFFRYGIIGFIIYMLPVFIVIFKVAYMFLKNIKNIDLEKIIYSYSTAIGIATGFFIGHVFGSPPVSIYLAIIACLTLKKLEGKYIRNINKDKVTFLALHLGVGGIENATVNTANNLSNTKEVEIISFYKLSDEALYKINDNIKIKYLYYGRPNKEEFKEAVKRFDVVSIIKNAFLACKILYKKHYMMIKEIRNIKEGIVISTRIEFTTLLNKYGNKNVLKIAQEHYHHNSNPKYIKTMKNNYYNIDYVVALTEGLKNDYQEFLKGTNTKVVTIPNMLAETNHEISKLENKNVVFVGRLDAGKRINEIIDLAYELKDNDWIFNIIGGGVEYDNLSNQIKDLKLENKVNLLGSKPHNDVLDELGNSSIFIMTSISEGLPMVLLEAMSVGVPCIAYETLSGVRDIISDGIDGYVIKDRNKEVMLEKLQEIMNNSKLRKEFGKNAVAKSKQFSSQAITNKWLEFIDNAKTN